MQYLYFEDWSEFTSILDDKGVDHGGKIIKVYSSPKDPRLTRSSVNVVEVDDTPLDGETFEYGERGSWTGEQIEEKLLGLNDQAKRSVRALFRFANRKDLEICQTAMELIHKGDWLINHPLQDIDGLELALKAPHQRSSLVHLDIFTEKSLSRLATIVDISSESSELMSKNEGRILKNELQAEINSAGKERK